jgi:SAM-dependent methyltransferase
MTRFLLAALLALSTAASALEDVPFVTTPDNVTRAMLDLAKVGRGDFVIDLGSGDGRIVIEAARRHGARGLGVEIVPDLVRTSRENAKRAGVEKQAEFREQDLFQTDLAKATVITLYLLPDVNLQLRPKLLELKPGTRVVSHDWDMADWKPDKTITLDVPDKPIGLEKKSRVHLWIVPARVEGTWCGTGDARGMRLVLRQTFQDVRGEFFDGRASHPFEARIEGDALPGISTAAARFDLKAERRRIIMQRSGNPLARPPAVAFVPPAREGCR